MRNRDKALKWLADQSANPTQSWKGLCQSSARQAWSCPAWASSAKDAWAAVHDRYKVKCPDYKDKSWWQHIPAGAIMYSVPPTSKYGHAWVAAGDMTGWSVDYKRSGYIDLVEIRLKGWASYYEHTKGYILGCQWYEGDGWFKGITKDYWDGENSSARKCACWRMTTGISPQLQLGGWPADCQTSVTASGRTSPVKYEQISRDAP